MDRPSITAAMCASGRRLAHARLSPDGTRVAYLERAQGPIRLLVVPVVGGPELVLSTEPAPAGSHPSGGGVFAWAPDGGSIVFISGMGGLWRLPATGGPVDAVELDDATITAGISSPAVSPDGRFVALTRGDCEVVVVPLGEDRPPVAVGQADFCFDPSWSPDGSWLAWHAWDVPAMAWDESRIDAVPFVAGRPDGPVRTVLGGHGAGVGGPAWDPSGRWLGALCDRRGWLNVWLVDPRTGEQRSLREDPAEHGDPTWGPGARWFAWSPDGRHIAHARNEAGFGALHVVEVETGGATPVGRGVHVAIEWRGEHIVALRSGARTPTQLVSYDAAAVLAEAADGEQPQPRRAVDPIAVGRRHRRVLAIGPVAGFDDRNLHEPESITFPADDGTVLHARLHRRTVPGDAEGARPTLVWIHGGPTGQWPVEFNARIAFFVDRGWHVLVPDHRGSTGHGRAYTQAMRGGWGVVDVADVAAAARVAVDRGWARPDQLVAVGASSGGATVLNLLAHHPGLFAAGVDLYGVTDFIRLDDTTHRFEAHYLESLVGPRPAAEDRYAARSPMTVADRIEAPLLVLHGDDDEVVPIEQSEALAERLRSLGRIVELHRYDGEGHGWNRVSVVIDEIERIEAFLRRHVLGDPPPSAS